MSREVRVHTDLSPPPATFRQVVAIGDHQLTSDEPADSGGGDAGPAPHELLLAALGSCTSMTVKVYADRKGWPVTRVEVRLERAQERREQGDVTVLRRTVHLEGPLSDEQRQRLLEIASKCPVHRTLTGEIEIPTSLG